VQLIDKGHYKVNNGAYDVAEHCDEHFLFDTDGFLNASNFPVGPEETNNLQPVEEDKN